METKYFNSASLLFIILFFHIYLPSIVAQESSFKQNSWALVTISKLEAKVYETNIAIQETKKNIEKCDATISKSEKILNLARQNGNSEAERVSLDAINKAGTAKKKIQII